MMKSKFLKIAKVHFFYQASLKRFFKLFLALYPLWETNKLTFFLHKTTVKTNHKNSIITFCIIILSFQSSVAQKWPYGGVPDESRKMYSFEGKPPLNFHKIAVFRGAKFSQSAYFEWAKFSQYTTFLKAMFDSTANFSMATFSQVEFEQVKFLQGASFRRAKFDNTVSFREAKFLQDANFQRATFSQDADFYNAKFDSIAYFFGAVFSQDADFTIARFSQNANFHSTKFGGTTNFEHATFSQDANFIRATFSRTANFGYAKFDSIAQFGNTLFAGADFKWAKFSKDADFHHATFDSIAYFSGTMFSQNATFRGTTFGGTAHFWDATFSRNADFEWALFSQNANFGLATFLQDANFERVTFLQIADFEGVTFKALVRMDECKFNKVLSLNGVNFEKGVNFRRAVFDSVQTIYVDHRTIFPEGKLSLYWDQFKGNDKLRIRLYNPPVVHNSSDSTSLKEQKRKIADIDSLLTMLDGLKVDKDSLSIQRDIIWTHWEQEQTKLDSSYKADFERVKKEHYQRIETFYYRLRDNFLTQGDKASADAVMFELGWQKKEIYGFWSWNGFWQTIYGWFLGWGYQPWRFLAFLVVPVTLFFATLWYFRYYKVLEKAIFFSELEGVSERIESQEGSAFQKIWHSLFFSASALLGIRFKKAWIIKHELFLFWVTLEWAIGIGLFVMFALLVKSNQFAYIKGLLGF